MKPTTRRRLASGLGALAVVSSLAACGSNGADQTPTGAPTATSSPSSSGDPSGSASGSPSSDGNGGSQGADPGTTDGTKGTGGASPSASDGGAGADSTGQHKNGTYTAVGAYLSPAGEQTINVSLEIKNDLVTAVTVTPKAEDPTAQRFQSQFASGISAVVVGKDIDDVQVGTISGSSLTGAGFDTALSDIATQSAF